MQSYGQRIMKGRAEVGHDWFRRQHHATVLPGHRILVFNNDSIGNSDKSSSLVIFDENAKNDSDGLLWRFDLKFDTLSDAKCTQTGSAELLANGNILTGMGTVNRIVEVTEDKQVVWDAFVYQKNKMAPSEWDPFAQYRVHHAPTLWPVLFGLQIDHNIVIQNLGTQPDRYALAYRNPGMPRAEIHETGTVMPGETLTLHKVLVKGSQVSLYSLSNPKIRQDLVW